MISIKFTRVNPLFADQQAAAIDSGVLNHEPLLLYPVLTGIDGVKCGQRLRSMGTFTA